MTKLNPIHWDCLFSVVFWNTWLNTNLQTMKLKIAWWLSAQNKAAWSILELMPLKSDYWEHRMASRLYSMKGTKGGRPSYIKGPLSYHETLLKLKASPAEKDRSESRGHCGKAFLYTALRTWRQVPTAGALPCQSYSLRFIPYTTGPVRREKKEETRKQLMLLWQSGNDL